MEDGKTVLDVTRENFILPVFDQKLSILETNYSTGAVFSLRGLLLKTLGQRLAMAFYEHRLAVVSPKTLKGICLVTSKISGVIIVILKFVVIRLQHR